MSRKAGPFLMIVSVILFYTSCTSLGSNVNFLLSSLYQDSSLNTILVGYLDYNELTAEVKSDASSFGYKSGDLIPARCVLRSLSSEEGTIYILKSPTKDFKTAEAQDWMNIGRAHPNLFDSMEKWNTRQKTSEN